jgi:hypothetical protein
MGTLDFLFDGKPPQSVTTYGQTVENMPKWLSDYTQGLIARGNAVAAEPYQAYQGPRVAGFSPDQNSAFGMTRQNVGDWQQPLGAASAYTQQAGNTNVTGAAQPYANAASGSFTGQNVQNYMDPYVGNVVNRAADLATRNYQEKILPGLNDQFTRGGQYGSSAHMREADRAARDVTTDIQSASNAALSQAYQTAGGLYGADASRYAGLAGTMGTLAGQQGQLQLNSGAQMGNLASALQQMGIRDSASLEAIGSQYQGLAQRNLDTAYGDFQNQTNYPRETVEWMSNLIRGLPFDKTQTTSQTGPATTLQPSPLAQLAGLGSVWAGINNNNTGGG